MPRTPQPLSVRLRQPLPELADAYGVSVDTLTTLLRRLHLTPHQGSLSMAQDAKLAAYLDKQGRVGKRESSPGPPIRTLKEAPHATP